MSMETVQKKVCIVGAYGVGKTSLVRRFVESVFDERYLSTVGVRIDKKIVPVDGSPVTFLIWDMAGEDDQHKLRTTHLRGASGFLLVVDGTRSITAERALELQKRIREVLGPVPFLVLANKSDLASEWDLSPALTATFESNGWRVLRTSAKTGENVELAFEELGRLVMAQPAKGE
jgi:small GTP-binding protein